MWCPANLDVTRLALAAFLARYREPTLTAYKQDWRCSSYGVNASTCSRFG